MVDYEKQVEQEAAYPIAYPIPISYNCYRHEKNAIRIAMPLVVQRYRDGVCNGVCSLLSHLFFASSQ